MKERGFNFRRSIPLAKVMK
uniref:Uncharacterized protein n=1 Tax=Rhizophora mucronata TaxID=61149 RepID=A0A2P2N736_RHIMU